MTKGKTSAMPLCPECGSRHHQLHRAFIDSNSLMKELDRTWLLYCDLKKRYLLVEKPDKKRSRRYSMPRF